MELTIIVSVCMLSLLNLLPYLCFRRGWLSSRAFRWVLVATNTGGIYIAQILLKIPWDSIFPVILAIIGGTSLGLSGARVIIRAEGNERVQSEE